MGKKILVFQNFLIILSEKKRLLKGLLQGKCLRFSFLRTKEPEVPCPAILILQTSGFNIVFVIFVIFVLQHKAQLAL